MNEQEDVENEEITWEGEEVLQVLHRLAGLDIDLGKATQQLEDEGVQKFIDSFDRLMDVLEMKRAAALGEAMDHQSLDLKEHLAAAQQRITDLEEERLDVKPRG